MNNIHLRPVNDHDAPFLASIMNTDAILHALNELPTTLADWADAISAWHQDDDEEDYIICHGQTPIGWLGINGLASENKTAYLKLIALFPDFHGKGIGEYVINQMIDALKKRSYFTLSLYTDQNNLKARACYKKCGFEVTEAFSEIMANGKSVARCKMERRL